MIKSTGATWTYVEEGGCTGGEFLVVCIRVASLDRSSCKRESVPWRRELPLCPEPVNHLERERVNRQDQAG